MLQRLPVALAQVKAGDNSENLLNEIRQIKKVTKKVYNNLMKWNVYYIYEFSKQKNI